jgi:hypothetical protein
LFNDPPENIVLSEVTPTTDPCPDGCYSVEDPSLPALAPSGIGTAVAVWHQNHTYAGTAPDIRGTFFSEPQPPDNDEMGNALLIETGVHDGSLARSTTEAMGIELLDFADLFGADNCSVDN